MDDKETKRKLNPLGKPVLDQRGDTPTSPVEVRKPLGKLIALRSPDWVKYALNVQYLTSFLPPNAGPKSVAAEGLFESWLAEGWRERLTGVLREAKLDLFLIPNVLVPKTGELRLDAEFELKTIEEMIRYDMAAEAKAVQENGYWTIPLTNLVLALVPCDSNPVDYQTGHLVLETPLSNIQARCENAQAICNRLVTERDEWIRDHLNPLLEDLKNQLLTESFPAALREEAEILRRNLVQDAEKLTGSVDLSADFRAALGRIRSTSKLNETELREQAKLPTTETTVSDQTSSSINAALSHLKTRLDKLSGEAQTLVQTFLDSLVESTAKKSKLFPTLDEKKEFAKELQAALDHVGLTILTSKGYPGRLDAYSAGGTEGGGFRLQATPSKNTENIRLPLKRPLVVAPKQLTDASSQRPTQ